MIGSNYLLKMGYKDNSSFSQDLLQKECKRIAERGVADMLDQAIYCQHAEIRE
jgi:hypothetical protein